MPPLQQLMNNVLWYEIFRRIWVNNASTNQERQPHIHHLLMFSLEPDQSGRHKINDKEPDRFVVKNMITYHSLPLVLRWKGGKMIYWHYLGLFLFKSLAMESEVILKKTAGSW